MSTLHEELAAYLEQRRALGAKLETVEYLLTQFCNWLLNRGKPDSFTINDAVDWARSSRSTNPRWWAQRLTSLRPFAGYLNAIGVNAPVIPRNLLPTGSTRAIPFIYTQNDVDAMLAACETVFQSERPKLTMSTLIGLLSATGLRPGEALGLTTPNINSGAGVLFIPKGKSPLDRFVPVDDSTLLALDQYIQSRPRLATRPDPNDPVFINTDGTQISGACADQHFRSITNNAGILPRDGARPRLHDFRHTFTTRHMIASYAQSRDPQRTLGLLATWLGHTHVTDTYWYLSAVPELMARAAHRIEDPSQGEPR